MARRSAEYSFSKDLNNIGKRLEWVKTKLGISLTKIAEGSQIPYATCWDRFSNQRTIYIEEYKALANFLNSEWQERFKDYFPSFEGIELRVITPMFIMFGDVDDQFSLKQQYEKRLTEMQIDFLNKENDYLRQISRLKQ